MSSETLEREAGFDAGRDRLRGSPPGRELRAGFRPSRPASKLMNTRGRSQVRPLTFFGKPMHAAGSPTRSPSRTGS